MLKSLHSLGSCFENFPSIQITSILSVIFTRLWIKCQRVFWWASCTSARHAGSFDCLMTSLILITMDNGRGHRAYWQSCKVPNQTHRGMKKIRKMYDIKQIKICADYRDMLTRPRLDLSGTPGLRQTSLGLGSMSRYSAQILICITWLIHYNDIIMSAMASQITSLAIVYSTVYSEADQRKHQSSAPLAFLQGINRGPVNFPHKWPIMRKMFPFDYVILHVSNLNSYQYHILTITCCQK